MTKHNGHIGFTMSLPKTVLLEQDNSLAVNSENTYKHKQNPAETQATTNDTKVEFAPF